MINIFGAIKTVATISKTIADVKKEIKKTKETLRNDMQPLEMYVNEPNENNIDITKMKKDINYLKRKLNELTSMNGKTINKKTADKKWYDE